MSQDVDSSALRQLLNAQREDSAIALLIHRRRNLEEAKRLEEVLAQLEELTADAAIARKKSDEITRRQTRLEGEMEIGDAKIEREEQRLFSGGVSNPKELGALQAEVEMLKRRRATLEDDLLEVMVQRDQANATLEALETEGAQTSMWAEELNVTVSSLTDEIDRELSRHQTSRTEHASVIPQPLLELYETLREAKGGVGAAELERDTCSGCHTKLPAREVERLRAEGSLQRCDNCRRILVVT
ncbi:MAG: hypothetical protein H0V97_06655 [Actinobacteria bacterium]|nr:hypothetical protein [Actinomycetota bacterium]